MISFLKRLFSPRPAKTSVRVRPRKTNELVLFPYDCVPDARCKETEYAGAEVHCILDRQISDMREFSEAETSALRFLAQSGWTAVKQAGDPVWVKPPNRVLCMFDKIAAARRAAYELARQDGISLIAYTWTHENAAPREIANR